MFVMFSFVAMFGALLIVGRPFVAHRAMFRAIRIARIAACQLQVAALARQPKTDNRKSADTAQASVNLS
jgi:hypothetical protein